MTKGIYSKAARSLCVVNLWNDCPAALLTPQFIVIVTGVYNDL